MYIHICISHWYDLWNLYEDIPFFLLRHLRPWSEIHWETSQSCDRQSIMEYKHATQKKQSALKNHVNILAGNSARMTTSEKKKLEQSKSEAKQNEPKGKQDKCQQAIPRSCQQMPSPEVYRLATILVLAGLYHGSIIRFASKAVRRSTGWFGGFRNCLGFCSQGQIWKFVLMSHILFPLNWCAFLSFFWPKSESFEIWIDLGNFMRFQKFPLFFCLPTIIFE